MNFIKQNENNFKIPALIGKARKAMEIASEKFPYAYVPFTSDKENIIEIDGEKVGVILAPTLTDAFIAAYPVYKEIFRQDPKFAYFVNSANGKWIEPKYGSDKFHVILSEKIAPEDRVRILCHELRHVYDFIKSWHRYEGFENGKRALPNLTEEFSLWSEFNAVYTDTVASFLTKGKGPDFEDLSSYLGAKTADVAHRILQNRESDYFLHRYLGVQRAIRDLSEVYAPSPAFQLWNMTPLCIEKAFPNSFYLARKYQEKEYFIFDR